MSPTLQRIFAGGLGFCLLLGACGDSDELPTAVTTMVGTDVDGVPLAVQASDPGILKDQAGYQPTAPPESGPGGGAADPGTTARPGSVVSSSAQQQVESFVRDFGLFIRDYELRAAIQAFNSEHVATLLEDDRYDVMFTTAEAAEALARKLPDADAARLLGPLYGAWGDAVEVAVISKSEASVKPNITEFFFGPVRTTETVTLRLQDNEWKIQLASPLTESEADAVVAHHEQLQNALYEIVDWLDANEDADRAPAEAAIAAARRGEPIQLPGAGG
jgi:hypothetical protein